jgi:hypothetical protein
VIGALAQTYDYVVAAAPALATLRGAERLARFARATVLIADEGGETAASAAADALTARGFVNVTVAAGGGTPEDRSSGRVAA